MLRLLRAALPVLTVAACAQQLPFPSFLNPSFLYVGSGTTQLTISNQNYGAGLTALWNGSPRPTAPAGNGIFAYTITLTAEDLAFPQLGMITMVDSKSGAVIDTVNCPVGYSVKPTGVALDSLRNRLYVATPPQTGDSRFPPNSVVAVDLALGNVGSVLPVGSALGDVVLSDDSSALYVVVEGNNVVRRIDPATMTAVGDFNFRPAGTKPSYSGAMARDMLIVMPGQPGTVALEFPPQVGFSGDQVAIFDNGIQRANTLALYGPSGILFSPDGKYLFVNGVTTYSSTPNAGGTLPAILRYSVDATGIPKQTPPVASGSGPAAALEGTLYTSMGSTIDYASMQLTGTFGVGGPITVDVAEQRAFLLYTPPALSSSGQTPPIELVAFTLPSMDALGTQAVGISSDPALNDSKKLIRFGVDGFVVSSTAGLLIFHSSLAGPLPGISVAGIGNAASQVAGPVAPGEVISIYGSNLGPATPQLAVPNASSAFPFVLGGVQVWFGRLPGALLMVSQRQINVVAPFELQPGSNVDVQVWNYGVPSSKVSLPVVGAMPALVTRNGSGSGPVAMINQDQSVNTPAPADGVVALFGTGGGWLSGAVDGAMARTTISLGSAVRVSIAGRDAPVLYAGAAPGLINGAIQINVQIPADAPSGLAPITVNVNGQTSPAGATIEIR